MPHGELWRAVCETTLPNLTWKVGDGNRREGSKSLPINSNEQATLWMWGGVIAIKFVLCGPGK